MKDFDYYKTNIHEYPNRFEYRKKLIDEIDNTPLTKEQHKVELDKVDGKVRDWFKEAMKPHSAEASKLDREFWADCREELGYDKYLNETGVAMLERQAYEDGHAYGYSEVFSKLQDLEQFVDEIRRHLS